MMLSMVAAAAPMFALAAASFSRLISSSFFVMKAWSLNTAGDIPDLSLFTICTILLVVSWSKIIALSAISPGIFSSADSISSAPCISLVSSSSPVAISSSTDRSRSLRRPLLKSEISVSSIFSCSDQLVASIIHSVRKPKLS